MSASHPLVVVGLDGATYAIIQPLIQAGELPNLGKLLSVGLATELVSTLPTATLPAWTSFLTGVNPGTHGITDMFYHLAGSYDLAGCTGGRRQVPTCLARLSSLGYRTACIGIPGTFPPEEINGICISGFDAPGGDVVGDAGIWPPEIRSHVRGMGGWKLGVFNEHSRDADRLEKASHRLLADIDKKQALLQSLYEMGPWDLFAFHLQASDTASHHAWHTWDASSPRASAHGMRDILPAVYRRLDTLIGWFMQQQPETGRILVVSDHGFGGASTQAVYLNRWLHQAGHLEFAGAAKQQSSHTLQRASGAVLHHVPHGLFKKTISLIPPGLKSRLMTAARGGSVNYRQSHAFSDELDYAPTIWMNRRSKFKQGTLCDNEADALAMAMVRELETLCYPGNNTPLFAAVHLRHQVQRGPCLSDTPDIILEPNWDGGYRPSFLRSQGPGPVVRTLSANEYSAPKGSGMPGVHHRNGVFIAAGAGLKNRKLPQLSIEQGGALIYSLMGVPIPKTVGTELPSWLNAFIPSVYAACDEPSETIPIGAAQENTSVLERLKAMGYLDG